METTITIIILYVLGAVTQAAQVIAMDGHPAASHRYSGKEVTFCAVIWPICACLSAYMLFSVLVLKLKEDTAPRQ